MVYNNYWSNSRSYFSYSWSNWIIIKTNASINSKLKNIVFKLNIALSILTVISLYVWTIVKPNAFDNFVSNPYLIVFPLIYFIGLIGVFFVKKTPNPTHPFLFSTLIILGGITSSIASLYPTILPSTNNINEDLTIYNTAATKYGLSVAMNWVIVGIVLIIIYFIIQKKLMKGKIDDMDYGH